MYSQSTAQPQQMLEVKELLTSTALEGAAGGLVEEAAVGMTAGISTFSS